MIEQTRTEPETGQHATATSETAPATASADPKAQRTARRWPWIVALVVVAAAGATATGLAMADASNAQAELAALQAEYDQLETRAGISQSSLELIRDHRDRLEVQLEELQAEIDGQ